MNSDRGLSTVFLLFLSLVLLAPTFPLRAVFLLDPRRDYAPDPPASILSHLFFRCRCCCCCCCCCCCSCFFVGWAGIFFDWIQLRPLVAQQRYLFSALVRRRAESWPSFVDNANDAIAIFSQWPGGFSRNRVAHARLSLSLSLSIFRSSHSPKTSAASFGPRRGVPNRRRCRRRRRAVQAK